MSILSPITMVKTAKKPFKLLALLEAAGDVKAPQDTASDAMADPNAMDSSSTPTDTDGSVDGSDSANSDALGGSTGPSGTSMPDGTSDGTEAAGEAPGGGNGILGGSSGGGSGGAGFGGGGEATGEEETGDSSEPKEPVDDPVSFVVDNVKELVKNTQSVPAVLKQIKSDLQYNVKARDQLGSIVSKLKAENNPTLSAAVDRLEQFLGPIQEKKKMTEKTNKFKITEAEIRTLVRSRLEKVIAENSSISAVRSLVNIASENVFGFEQNFIKNLGLMPIDEMDANSQRVFLAAMDTLKKKFAAAVIDAIKEIENLPKQQEESK